VAIGAAGKETERDSTRAPLSAWPDNSSAAQKSIALDTSAVHTLGSHCTMASPFIIYNGFLPLREKTKKRKKKKVVSFDSERPLSCVFCLNQKYGLVNNPAPTESL
jgi:hypothetical protein